jgi:5-methylcytosine-specific restriction endonuclease McrA
MSRRKQPKLIPGDTPLAAQDIEPLPPKRGRAAPKIPREKKERLLRRDGYRCVQCSVESNLTIDHIKPWSKGGTNRMENLQILCDTCNWLKADQERRVPRRK